MKILILLLFCFSVIIYIAYIKQKEDTLYYQKKLHNFRESEGRYSFMIFVQDKDGKVYSEHNENMYLLRDSTEEITANPGKTLLKITLTR